MDRIEPVFFKSPLTASQSDVLRDAIAEKLPAEKARIQGLVEHVIKSITQCDPKWLLAIASYTVLLYKLSNQTDGESLKWRSIEFIQNILVTHKVEVYDCSEDDMVVRCKQTVEEVEQLYMEMMPFMWYHNAMLHGIKTDEAEIDFLQNALAMYVVRGKRDITFNKRYFSLLLGPQDENFKRFYGISSTEIINGILKLIDVLFESKVKTFLSCNARFCKEISSSDDESLPGIIESGKRCVLGEIKDVSVFDVANITGWPQDLISDLSLPVASGNPATTHEYQFWPIDDLAIRDRPFIILDGKSYCFDYYTIVDNIYHALFVLCRNKEGAHGNLWSDAQSNAIENGVADVLQNLLPGVMVLTNVYYSPTGRDGDRRELDVVALCAGLTIVIETKGIAAVHESPMLAPDKILSFYRNSANKAGQQTRKFFDFLADKHTRKVVLTNKDGDVVFSTDKTSLGKVCRLCVVADATNEILACNRKLKTVSEDVDGLVCLALDDLLVYEKYFEAEPMQFMAYISERVDAAMLDNVQCSDELDHLGLYISNPHYVQDVLRVGTDGRNERTMMILDDNRRALDGFFDSLRNLNAKKPELYLPIELRDLMSQVWKLSVNNKLQVASLITGLTTIEKDWLASALNEELGSQRAGGVSGLRCRPAQWSDINVGISLLVRTPWTLQMPKDVWMTRIQGMMTKFNEAKRKLLILDYDPSGALVSASVETITPNDFNPKYADAAREFSKEIDRRVLRKVKAKGSIGRNVMCPCGSGLKYKKCCGR